MTRPQTQTPAAATAQKRRQRWLRSLRRERDMRLKANIEFIRHVSEIVDLMGGEPNVLQRDLILRYAHIAALVGKLENEQRAGGSADVGELLRLGERLLRQAKLFNALPRPSTLSTTITAERAVASVSTWVARCANTPGARRDSLT